LASSHSIRARQHAETLTPAIAFTCQQARIELSEVSVVAVDLGPGLFTGLRVGVASAKAMAHALRVPMIGVSSLDLLAFAVRFTPRLIGAVVDARRGEVYHAFYRQVPGGIQRVSEPAVGPPDDVASEVLAGGEDCLLVGDGALRYREVFDGLHQVEVADAELAYPSASSLVMLAHARALREQWVKPWEIEPLYLRKPDAEIGWITREQA
jgi:tRNA threonylcarbamoyladenosine biosynthesis protein TsaB